MLELLLLAIGIFVAVRRPRLTRLSAQDFPDVKPAEFAEWHRAEHRATDAFLWLTWGALLIKLYIYYAAQWMEPAWPAIGLGVILLGCMQASKAAELKKAAGVEWPKRYAAWTRGAKAALWCAIAAGGIVVVATVVVTFKAKEFVRLTTGRAADAVIERSFLPSAEKAEARETLRRFLKQAAGNKVPPEMNPVLDTATKGSLRKMAAIGAANKAIEKSNLSAEEKKQALEKARKLFTGIDQKQLSESEIESVLSAMPKDKKGRPSKPPWSDEKLREVLAQAERVLQGKEIKPDYTAEEASPALADDVRKAVRSMKEAMGETP